MLISEDLIYNEKPIVKEAEAEQSILKDVLEIANEPKGQTGIFSLKLTSDDFKKQLVSNMHLIFVNKEAKVDVVNMFPMSMVVDLKSYYKSEIGFKLFAHAKPKTIGMLSALYDQCYQVIPFNLGKHDDQVNLIGVKAYRYLQKDIPEKAGYMQTNYFTVVKLYFGGASLEVNPGGKEMYNLMRNIKFWRLVDTAREEHYFMDVCVYLNEVENLTPQLEDAL